MGKIEFTTFVSSLIATAAVALQEVEKLLGSQGTNPPTNGGGTEEERAKPAKERKTRVEAGLATAAQLIDTLAMLEDKTKGNVTSEERQLLQTGLTDLRFRYLDLLNRSRTSGVS
ncbi:MAG: DUF1844 domain-containing protein [Gemmatimonadales bacterium]